ncbi:MAG: polysaccharide deacetylase family protein [Lachnospiraceae bacterium]|nr:polysaccharide deacetylase family protein [Lachnospiraceae bacterium]
MVRSILWRLIGCLCFWWSLGLALFFISFGVNRIEKAVQNSVNPEQILSDQRPDRNTDAEFQDSVQTMENTGMGQSAAVQVSENSSIRAEKTIAAKVALTFDDGPHPVYTPELLDGLKERGVCATFFVVGENIPGNEEILKRMDAEGHLIGNHTYSHVKLSELDTARACAEVEKTNALICEVTGKEPEFIRPPFGEWKKAMECSFEMIPVLWDVDPLDWTTKNTALVVERVLKDTKPGNIILLHDYYQSSVDAALEIVDTLTQRGYEFVTVDELILE